MSILERFIKVFAPHACLGCGAEEDALLCGDCRRHIPLIPSRCYRCRVQSAGYMVCANCAERTTLERVLVYTEHKASAKELIHRMKYERAQAGTVEVAALLAQLASCLPTDVVFAYIPTATSRVRARGYDHARLLARSLARQTSLPCRVLLRRVGQAHQVGANRAERLRQLDGAFRPAHLESIRGRHVVLVDDVLTTGATLETAARVLKGAGAMRVSAIVFAQA